MNVHSTTTPSEDEVHSAVELWRRLLNLDSLDKIDSGTVDADFLKRIPIQMARQGPVLGLLADSPTHIHMVVDSDQRLTLADNIARYLGKVPRYSVAHAETIRSAINLAYQQRGSETDTLIDSLDRSQVLQQIESMLQKEDLLDTTGRAPVIRLVNLILFDAVNERASDVHVQPYEESLVVRFRIDGVLFDQFTVPKSVQEELISRIKVIGHMNIAEKRLPQDGRASVQVGERQVDLRIASLPTSYGERVVIRLLDKSARRYTLSELGMADTMLERFKRIVHREHGLVLVTGPTGGGKSTTLYAALSEINTKDRNVVTLEDPIEYQLDGVSQTQISEKKGLTFASGLRSVLRQDPDIIMVGEIRDQETAEMAIQSALTGHMVFSTLHTNDAASSVTRLLDLGIEPYLVASSLVGVLAQRLVRQICQTCKAKSDSLADEFVGEGCPQCRQTGYLGRLGVFELMMVDDELQSLIQTRQSASKIRAHALSSGMRLLREDGMDKVQQGRTTRQEVLRVSTEQS